MGLELQLICHGSMAFFYRSPGERGLDYDGYTIFIPRTPMTGHDMDHELRMGVGAGAVTFAPQLRHVPDPPVDMKTVEYELRFDWKPSKKKRGAKPALETLGLYQRKNIRAEAQLGGPIGVAGVAFAIDIPYPHREEVVRVADYKRFPFVRSKTVSDFDLKARRLTGARVFTYDLASRKRGVILQNENSKNDRFPFAKSVPRRIKIHLYNQAQVLPNPERDVRAIAVGHNEELNQAFRVKQRPIKLKQNPRIPRTIDPEGVDIPDGLGFRDLLHLAELYLLYPELRPTSKEPGGPRVQSLFHGFGGFDPAECTQPEGCPTEDPPPFLDS
jgi:hypothetical protein